MRTIDLSSSQKARYILIQPIFYQWVGLGEPVCAIFSLICANSWTLIFCVLREFLAFYAFLCVFCAIFFRSSFVLIHSLFACLQAYYLAQHWQGLSVYQLCKIKPLPQDHLEGWTFSKKRVSSHFFTWTGQLNYTARRKERLRRSQKLGPAHPREKMRRISSIKFPWKPSWTIAPLWLVTIIL